MCRPAGQLRRRGGSPDGRSRRSLPPPVSRAGDGLGQGLTGHRSCDRSEYRSVGSGLAELDFGQTLRLRERHRTRIRARDQSIFVPRCQLSEGYVDTRAVRANVIDGEHHAVRIRAAELDLNRGARCCLNGRGEQQEAERCDCQRNGPGGKSASYGRILPRPRAVPQLPARILAGSLSRWTTPRPWRSSSTRASIRRRQSSRPTS